MTTTIERLRTALGTLNLNAVDARLEGLLEAASKKEPSYADFLLEVISAEVDTRRQRYLKARLQLAHLPYVKTFDQFDFAFQPSIDERQIRELRTLRFVHEASNVILLGPPGVGKTHLAVALAEAAIQSAQAAYFMTAHDLVTDLGRAYREGRLDRRLRVYLAPKVLIIDLCEVVSNVEWLAGRPAFIEVGLVPLHINSVASDWSPSGGLYQLNEVNDATVPSSKGTQKVLRTATPGLGRRGL